MKKKILAAIAAGLICVSMTGCGKLYQETVTHLQKRVLEMDILLNLQSGAMER